MNSRKDPFSKAFYHVSKGKSMLNQNGQWEEYLNLLEERGLLQENERQSLEDLPTQQSSSSLYRNEGNNTDDITLSTFQHMLMDLTETKTRCHDAIDTAITNLNAQATSFHALSKQWDIDTLDELEIHQLLTLVNGIDELQIQASSTLAFQTRYQENLLCNQSVHTLFWKPLYDAEGDTTVYDAPTALHYQSENITALERIVQKRRVKHVKLANKGKNIAQLEDTFGHTQGTSTGIVLLKGHSETGVVQVVAISKEGVSAAQLQHMYNTASAHRQMALSPSVQHFLGNDIISSSKDSFFYYEHIEATSLQTLLMSTSSRPVEQSPLFRIWIRGILTAIQTLSEQCTHRITGAIGVHNLFIASTGLRVVLGRVSYGPTMESLNEKMATLHKKREAQLIVDFASIAHTLICPTTVPDNKEEYRAKYIAGNEMILQYTLHSETPSMIHLTVGDRFTVDLQSENSKVGTTHQSILSTNWTGPFNDSELLLEQNSALGEPATNRTVFIATEEGLATVYFDQKSSDASTSVYEIEIQIHPTTISPTLQAIFKCCMGQAMVTPLHPSKTPLHPFKNNESNKPLLQGIRVPTFNQLQGHPYFRKSRFDDDEGVALLDYEKRYGY